MKWIVSGLMDLGVASECPYFLFVHFAADLIAAAEAVLQSFHNL